MYLTKSSGAGEFLVVEVDYLFVVGDVVLEHTIQAAFDLATLNMRY